MSQAAPYAPSPNGPSGPPPAPASPHQAAEITGVPSSAVPVRD
jgi:hypothetical protein